MRVSSRPGVVEVVGRFGVTDEPRWARSSPQGQRIRHSGLVQRSVAAEHDGGAHKRTTIASPQSSPRSSCPDSFAPVMHSISTASPTGSPRQEVRESLGDDLQSTVAAP